MPPRRNATADTPAPGRVLPTSSDEMAELIRINVGSHVLMTGMIIPPGSLPNSMSRPLQVAQQAIQFSTSPGQSHAGQTLDFILSQRVSQDYARLAQAITNQAARGRFR